MASTIFANSGVTLTPAVLTGYGAAIGMISGALGSAAELCPGDARRGRVATAVVSGDDALFHLPSSVRDRGEPMN
ncbi:MAG: hypothetical protein M9891_10990 [Austwickia sp.]|nr:hypothetical protein [Austwickia sp.]